MPLRRRFVTLVSLVSLALGLGPACTPSSTARAPAATDSASSSPEPSASQPTTAAPELAENADVPTVMGPAPVPVPPDAPPSRPMLAQPVMVPRPAGPYGVRIVDESSHRLPTFVKDGHTYVMGSIGSRYSIVVSNPTAQRVEAVVSVDGLDAMDGHPADYVAKRGYILAPYGTMSIDGFRTSYDAVATFRFSSVTNSYAGRLGEARDVGVIGVAFFPERVTYDAPPPPVAAETTPYGRPAHRAAARAPRSPSLDQAAPAAAPRALPGPSANGLASTAGGGAAPPSPPAEKRPGLGTEFGEARESHINSTSFDRANRTTPSQVLSFRYNDRAGLLALGIPVQPVYPSVDLSLRETAEPFRSNGFAQPPP